MHIQLATIPKRPGTHSVELPRTVRMLSVSSNGDAQIALYYQAPKREPFWKRTISVLRIGEEPSITPAVFIGQVNALDGQTLFVFWQGESAPSF